MNTLILASYPPSILNFRRSLLLTLRDRGHNISIIAPSCLKYKDLVRFANLHSFRLFDIPLCRTGTNIFLEIFTLLSILFLILRLRPNVILAYTIKPVLYSGLVLFLLRTLRIRVCFLPLITGLGFVFTEHKFSILRSTLKFLLSRFYRLSLSPASSVVFQNPDDIQFFLDQKLISPSKNIVRTWGSGVDINHFAPEPLPQAHVFLMLSRLLRDKGLIEYIHAAKIVKSLYPDAIFHLAGMFDSNPASISPSLLTQLTEDGCVSYLGDVPDVRPLLAACRYYVLPSYREGTPRSTLEALSTGRPILTTDVPGCRETVIHDLNGYLVRSRDASDLAAHMIKLINLPDSTVDSMAFQSRQIAISRYDVHLVNQQILQCLP